MFTSHKQPEPCHTVHYWSGEPRTPAFLGCYSWTRQQKIDIQNTHVRNICCSISACIIKSLYEDKDWIVNGRIDSAKSLCTTEPGLKEELQWIDASLRKNCYSTNTVKKGTRGNQEKLNRPTVEYKHMVIVLYTVSFGELEMCHKYHIWLVAKSTDKINNRLNKAVPKRSPGMHQYVIDSVPLHRAIRLYIGVTGRIGKMVIWA